MSIDGLEVRPAQPADLDALLVLYGQLADQRAVAPTDEIRQALGQMVAASFVNLLVADRRGEVVGTVELVVVPNVTHGGRPWAQLENMVVGEDVRGLGIGRALLQRCAEIARDHNCYKIQLQSANHRTPAHRFYEAFGFTASSAGYRWYLS